MSGLKPWLIGETNPYQATGADARHVFDLYHEPPHSAGGRLCRHVLGLEPHVYRREFVRRNLLSGPWNSAAAEGVAAVIERESGGAALILLGAKVARAFGLDFVPFRTGEFRSVKFAILPHPSGRSRAWNAPDSVERARRAVLEVAPHLRAIGVRP